jgi:hypothetical protein
MLTPPLFVRVDLKKDAKSNADQPAKTEEIYHQAGHLIAAPIKATAIFAGRGEGDQT